MQRLVIEVEDELKHKIDVKAANENKTLKDLITPLLEEKFADVKIDKKKGRS